MEWVASNLTDPNIPNGTRIVPIVSVKSVRWFSRKLSFQEHSQLPSQVERQLGLKIPLEIFTRIIRTLEAGDMSSRASGALATCVSVAIGLTVLLVAVLTTIAASISLATFVPLAELILENTLLLTIFCTSVTFPKLTFIFGWCFYRYRYSKRVEVRSESWISDLNSKLNRHLHIMFYFKLHRYKSSGLFIYKYDLRECKQTLQHQLPRLRQLKLLPRAYTGSDEEEAIEKLCVTQGWLQRFSGAAHEWAMRAPAQPRPSRHRVSVGLCLCSYVEQLLEDDWDHGPRAEIRRAMPGTQIGFSRQDSQASQGAPSGFARQGSQVAAFWFNRQSRGAWRVPNIPGAHALLARLGMRESTTPRSHTTRPWKPFTEQQDETRDEAPLFA